MWTSMIEQEPDKPGRFLVYHWYMKMVDICYWTGHSWQPEWNITHWMALPEKPNDSTETALEMGIAIMHPSAIG